jgi:hypothetical protein
MDNIYPYRRFDSYISDNTGYFWGFGQKTAAGATRVNAFFLDNNRGIFSPDQLSVVTFTANEYNGSIPTYSTPVKLVANGSSYFNGGNVGIGTTNPAAKLHVVGSSILSNSTTINPDSYTGVVAGNIADGSGWGVLGIGGNNGSTGRSFGMGVSGKTFYMGFQNGSTATSLQTFLAVSGSRNLFLVPDGGNVGIGTTAPTYKLEVNGSFAASTKSFKIDHPIKPGKKLVYGSLESPYHGIRLTGKDTLVGAKCVVKLPDYICKLVRAESVNVQLTGIKCGKTLYIDDINVDENYFVVAYEKSMLEFNKTYEFFWDFTAIRADVPELMTEV